MDLDEVTREMAIYAVSDLIEAAESLAEPANAYNVFWALLALCLVEENSRIPHLAGAVWYAAREVTWEIIALA